MKDMLVKLALSLKDVAAVSVPQEVSDFLASPLCSQAPPVSPSLATSAPATPAAQQPNALAAQQPNAQAAQQPNALAATVEASPPAKSARVEMSPSSPISRNGKRSLSPAVDLSQMPTFDAADAEDPHSAGEIDHILQCAQKSPPLADAEMTHVPD